MTENEVPIAIRIENDEWLVIEWSLTGERRVRLRELRDRCPCATCREKRLAASQSKQLLPILKAEELVPLRIKNMRPVGNYAYNIGFSDGHGSGIYTLDLLHEIGTPCQDRA